MSKEITASPVIKWSGSKRSQVTELIKYFPNKFKTYYEPFIGGGSMMRKLIDSRLLYSFERVVCSDLNSGLIDLWNSIKCRPDDISTHYENLWKEMNSIDDRVYKRKYFERIRERYNKEHNPLDFMFIMRTTTNGMPRYNKSGEFNNSFHITRKGIEPETLHKIITDWSRVLNEHNVEFLCRSYEELNPEPEDFLYMDPPYAGTVGMYFGNFDTDKFFRWLRDIKCRWLLSYNGKSNEIDNTYDVPSDIYDEHKYIKSGNSSFKRTIGKDSDVIVYESLYIKR